MSWSAQILFERVFFCELRASKAMQTPERLYGTGLETVATPGLLRDGDMLFADRISEHFDQRWLRQEQLVSIEEVNIQGHAMDHGSVLEALVLARPSSWSFVQAADTWLHRAEAGRSIERLRASGLLQLATIVAVMFAFIVPGTSDIDLRAGLLMNVDAARVLVKSWPRDRDQTLNVDRLQNLGITVIHQPLLVPDAFMLPRGLRGMVSEGAVSGVWSIGQVRNLDMMDDLEEKVHGRAYVGRLLSENFADLYRAYGRPMSDKSCGPTSESSLVAARSWLKFLHDDDEHIKVVRGFKGGRREFRTQHAMYRSETLDVLPLHGVGQDTVLVARDCARPRDT
mmetsp:Transcript_44106/g.113523  ORF Transcript_44106/g.113523 Transcript_44106/m.113523 type:complete len:340 (+) Transcript_44106:1-1020(+)